MQYTQSDIQLVTTTGGAIMLDGADITLALTPFGSNAWSAARIQVAPGSHVIECPMGCSVEVDGWDLAVSFMYSGGLDLAPIVL